MRVVLDTNVFLSALISHNSPPFRIYQAWREGRFELITAKVQIEELRRASRYPKLATILDAHLVGRMVNHLNRAVVFENLPHIHEADDPDDSWLLALADVGRADLLVTGDKKSGLLGRRRVGTARILTAAALCALLD